jgi:hypothetical protein
MASGGGGGGKIPWKLILILAAYAFLAYAVPQFRPANIAHSLQIFAQTVQAGQSGG